MTPVSVIFMVSVTADYISVGGNRHPAAADWDVQSGVLAFGADNNVALWDPRVCAHWRLFGYVTCSLSGVDADQSHRKILNAGFILFSSGIPTKSARSDSTHVRRKARSSLLPARWITLSGYGDRVPQTLGISYLRRHSRGTRVQSIRLPWLMARILLFRGQRMGT